MPSRVLVTGASGFVGTAIVDELISRNISVVALINRRALQSRSGSVQIARASVFDDKSLDAAMSGCDAIIHLVGIIMEKRSAGVTFQRIHVDGTRSVLDAAKRNGITRYIHMSALGTRPHARSEYHRTKFAAEELVRASGLNWTIFRPSLIHGPDGEFMKMEAMWAKKRAPFPVLFMPFMPYFGAGALGFGGAGLLQPVHVGDVARAFVDSVQNLKTAGEIYPLGGPDQMTWPQLHHAVSQAVVGKKRLVLPIPVWAGKFYAAVGIAPLLGFNRDQVLMSQEDNTCDITKFVDAFGWEPRAFEESLRQYASKL